MLIQENLIIVVERNIEQKDRKVKASEFLVANHNHRITELQFIAFCNIKKKKYCSLVVGRNWQIAKTSTLEI